MARQIRFTAGVINVTAHPHSPETYLSLFQDAFTETPPTPVHYHGNDLVALKVLAFKNDSQGPYIHGIIYKFTQIRDRDWYDALKGVPLENEEDKPNIDIKRIFPNLVVSDFCFLPQGHRIFVVTKYNDFSLSLQYFSRSLRALFNRDFLVEKYGNINVSIGTDKKAIEDILRMETISRLMIRVNIPNDDDASDMKKIIIERMRKQNSQAIDAHLVAEKGKSLKPDNETKALMDLALSNGYVRAKGIENKQSVTKNSSDTPIQYVESYNEEQTTLWDKLLELARSHLPFFKSRQKDDDNLN